MNRPRNILFFFGRFLAALLMAALSLPAPAFALRPMLTEKSGLEEALSAGLEEGTAEGVAEKAGELAGRIRVVLEEVKGPLGILIDLQLLGDSHDAYRKSLIDQIKKSRDAIQQILKDTAGQAAQSEKVEDKVFVVVIAGEVTNKLLKPFDPAFDGLEVDMEEGKGITDLRLNELKSSLDESLTLIERFSQKPKEDLIADSRKTWEMVYLTEPFPIEMETSAGLEEGPLTVEGVRRVAAAYHQTIQDDLEAIRFGLENGDFKTVASRAASILDSPSLKDPPSNPLGRLTYATLERELSVPLSILKINPPSFLFPDGKKVFQDMEQVLKELESVPSLRVTTFGPKTVLLLNQNFSLGSLGYKENTEWLDGEAKELGADRILIFSLISPEAAPSKAVLRPHLDLIRSNRYQERLEGYFQKANEEFQQKGIEVKFNAPERLYIMKGETPNQYDFVIYDGKEVSTDVTSAGYRHFQVDEVLRMHPFLLAKKVLDPKIDLELLLSLFKGAKVKKIEVTPQKEWVVLFASS